MTYIGITMRSLILIIVWGVIFFGSFEYGKHKEAVGYSRGVQTSLGQPVFYSELPIGHYTVVDIIIHTQGLGKTAIVVDSDHPYPTISGMPREETFRFVRLLPEEMRVGSKFEALKK